MSVIQKAVVEISGTVSPKFSQTIHIATKDIQKSQKAIKMAQREWVQESENGTRTVVKNYSSIGAAATSVFKGISISAIAAFGLISAAAINFSKDAAKEANKYEQSWLRIKTAMELSVNELKKFQDMQRKAALNDSTKPALFIDAADTYRSMTGETDPAKISDRIMKYTDISRAMGIQTSSSLIKAVTQIRESMPNAGSEQRVLDKIVTVFTKSKFGTDPKQFNELVEIMGTFAKNFARHGIGADEMFTSVLQLGNMYKDIHKAETAIDSVIRAFDDTSGDLASIVRQISALNGQRWQTGNDMLRSVGLSKSLEMIYGYYNKNVKGKMYSSSGAPITLESMFSISEAKNAVEALASTGGNVAAIRKDLANAEATRKLYQSNYNLTYQAKLDNLIAAWEQLKIDVGLPIIDALKNELPKLREGILKFSDYITTNREKITDSLKNIFSGFITFIDKYGPIIAEAFTAMVTVLGDDTFVTSIHLAADLLISFLRNFKWVTDKLGNTGEKIGKASVKKRNKYDEEKQIIYSVITAKNPKTSSELIKARDSFIRATTLKYGYNGLGQRRGTPESEKSINQINKLIKEAKKREAPSRSDTAISASSSWSGTAISAPKKAGSGVAWDSQGRLIPTRASGGWTDGLTLAGEAGREAVISFLPQFRQKNTELWAQAGSKLGAFQNKVHDKVGSLRKYTGLIPGANNKISEAMGKFDDVIGGAQGKISQARGTVNGALDTAQKKVEQVVNFSPQITINGNGDAEVLNDALNKYKDKLMDEIYAMIAKAEKGAFT